MQMSIKLDDPRAGLVDNTLKDTEGTSSHQFRIIFLNMGQLWDTFPVDLLGPRVHAFVISIDMAVEAPWSGTYMVASNPAVHCDNRVHWGADGQVSPRGLCCFGEGRR